MTKVNGAVVGEVTSGYEVTEKPQKGMVKILKTLLADESVLYTKLQNYHWNVTGANFFPLHAAFENQFYAIADITDGVAERIRQHGVYAPATMEEFLQKTRLSEAPGNYPDAQTMVANLVTDHETIIHHLHEDIKKTDDVGVVDLLINILQQHEKMAWMLRMNIAGKPAVNK